MASPSAGRPSGLPQEHAVVPLSVGVSRYNAAYYCTVRRAYFDHGNLCIEFEVVGDMSRGALQDPLISKVTWRAVVPSGSPTSTVSPWRIELFESDRRTQILGKLVYRGVPESAAISFTFGSGGYSGVVLSDGEAVRRPDVELLPPNPSLDEEITAIASNFALLAQERTRVPLSVGVSRYNAAYYCTVRRAYFDRSSLCVEFEVVGDMSMGALQDPLLSKVTWRAVVPSSSPTSTVSPWRIELFESDRRMQILGKLVYRGVPEIAAISFTFGSGGYSGVVLSDGEGVGRPDAERLLLNSRFDEAITEAVADFVLAPSALPAADLWGQDRGVCVVCAHAVADAMFLHGSTGHTACCMPCAEEIRRRRGTCPICRQRFSAVIRNFSA